ncbi:short chain enoyl-CoA hydratase [Arboricoccus pini]|uniref:enoyl-CoA hydratase n=1 Tax=Arboricoccus pini TaxID=1963835 RepID=A0A212QSW9_9PROT|nr:enoyl-CoA hydratase [Arboricoccus pini]SNB62529.1 short chain enoyl-CoA hydratase [Arboricoccus pini]
MTYETILVETTHEVGLVTLNRPATLNALNAQLISELEDALTRFDADPNVAATIITGSERAFAAGADVKEMVDHDFASAYESDFIGRWAAIASHRKPLIAAVAGFALGGGCELALMCDILIAAENAKFGQPEVNLGILPGAGGSQRLPRAVGKAKAMDMILTGRFMGAQEAERCGLVARVVPFADLLATAMQIGQAIAAKPRAAVQMAKEATNVAFETSLAEGLRFERRAFYATFASPEQREGMTAFLEKRKPSFNHGR